VSLKAKRVTFVFFLGVIVFALLTGRLFWLQIVRGGELKHQAAQIRVKNITTWPARGNIYDCNHNALVTSRQGYSIYLFSGKQEKNAYQTAFKIAQILKINPEEVYKKITRQPGYILIKTGVDSERVNLLRQAHIKGLEMEETITRQYPQENLAAHVLGFVGIDGQGLTGLEVKYDEVLRGKPGHLVMEKDAQERQLLQTLTLASPASPGNNLILTLDQAIQFFIERELDRIMVTYKPKQAVIIVMAPKTGAILALACRPTFYPDRWEKAAPAIWEKNPAISFNYEPGSTFKMFVAAAALEEKAVRKNEYFYCSGKVKIQGREIACWKKGGHGSISFKEGIQNSCNTVFIQTGLRLGKERFYEYLQAFGFGTTTGVDLPGEEEGIVIPPRKVTSLNLATMSIGQSVAVTPLQMLTATCAIANGGYLYQPYIVQAIEKPNGEKVKVTKPKLIRRVISPATARQLTEYLEKVVLEGTGKSAFVEGYRVAGKTGTAQVSGAKGYLPGKYVASFTGFAPVSDPKIAVLVLLDEPKGGAYHGGEVAAPAFSNVVRDTLHKLAVPEELNTQNLITPRAIQGQVAEPLTKKIVVPNVIGFPLSEAQNMIRERGLRSWTAGREGLVVGQKPAAGNQVLKGMVINLETGPFPAFSEKISVPDLTGLAVKQAGTILEKLGLCVEPKGWGLAVKQYPGPGNKVVKGTIIKVEFKPLNSLNKGKMP
jgi:stage V sporulation protein D (sporulation-specific penicillin-binding protein)